jgi:hypothetical protein
MGVKAVQMGLTVDVPGLGGPGAVIDAKGGSIEYAASSAGHQGDLVGTVKVTKVAGGTDIWLLPIQSVAWLKLA